MKKTSLLSGLSLLALGAALLQNCDPKKDSGNAYSQTDSTAAAPAACVAPANWFPHSQTPPPLEGAGSPFADPNTTSNCDFHQWSWQKFLYLTQTVNGRARFESLVQVSNQMDPLGNVLVLKDSSQAGTHTILTDKKNRAIYYSVYMDSSMYKFSLKYAKLFKDNCDSSGCISNVLLQKFHYDTLSYPIGSFEIKAAWILSSSLDAGEVSQFYTTQAQLNNTTVQVALVGMHIVGKVINHPELIWATYQHLGAAPVAPWPSGADTAYVTPDSTQILSTSNMLFYNANLPMDSCYISSNKPAGKKGPFKSIYHLFDHGIQVPYPGIIGNLWHNDTVSRNNIKSINASVLAQLATDNDAWKNYEYYGSLWIDPTTATLQPGDQGIGGLTRTNLRGSRALSNIAAETYIQSFAASAPTQTTSFNCFGCHNTANTYGNLSSGYNLALSHMFNNNLGRRVKGNTEQPHINAAALKKMAESNK